MHGKTTIKISRMIYCPLNDNGIWRKRYSSELYTLYNEPDVVKVVKIGRFRWLGKLFRMQELGPCRKLALLQPEGTLLVGKLRRTWVVSVE
jgi:hypothetical protein